MAARKRLEGESFSSYRDSLKTIAEKDKNFFKGKMHFGSKTENGVYVPIHYRALPLFWNSSERGTYKRGM